MINDASIIAGKPYVYGSVYHNTGYVSAFNLPGGPSFRCLYPQRVKHKIPLKSEGIPALNLLYRITGTLMAGEVLKIIQGLPSPLMGNLLHFHLDTYTTKLEPITRNEENFRIKSF
jgi:adenylyltransferase/sulfurtransferase